MVSVSSEDSITVHPEDDEVVDSTESDLGMKDVTGQKLNRGMKSVVKIPESKLSSAPWDNDPESPPREKAKSDSSSRQDDRSRSRDGRDQDRQDKDPNRSNQGDKQR